MTSDAERKLTEAGWPLEDLDFGREDEPDICGCILINEVDDGLQARLIIRPGLDRDLRASFAEWAVQRIGRFAEHGPEPDGWQRRTDGAWQLWARGVDLPAID
ncbi:hypothetical protein [Streptomyces wuyuanensis]|uniref:hypothetical protein n=1 Tax=Streptomyces wuyuanensis TaxID=1196353 RepID=UPI003442B626